MKIPISPRLLACAQFVRPGDRVADIGCDHGYLGIYLLQEGIARSVIAADINEGPLQAAFQNAHKYGCANGMSFHLSNGVKSVPRDFDTLVCAGMGAETMISILEAAPWLKGGRYRLILQCQTKTYLLRRYLSRQGWHINREIVLRDGKFLYTLMEVCHRPEATVLTPGQCYIPPAMLNDPSPELVEYYRWVCKEVTKIVTARADQADPFMRQAMIELTTDPYYAFLKEDEL